LLSQTAIKRRVIHARHNPSQPVRAHRVQIALRMHATKPRIHPAQTRYLPLPQRRIKVRAPS
jgi:hypothetical protein